MKTFKNLSIIAIITTFCIYPTIFFAQKNKSVVINENSQTIKFKVWGNCNTCKKNIEKSLKVKGVKKANWNKDSKIIEVTFDSSVITIEQIHKYIASAGYDTDLVKGNDNSYKKLDQCCQYERKN
ncbi:MAG: heavy-metal-associated domain-containing protein [Crocinitomicaceae bacterium]|jgi:copper chaperone CopZ